MLPLPQLPLTLPSPVAWAVVWVVVVNQKVAVAIANSFHVVFCLIDTEVEIFEIFDPPPNLLHGLIVETIFSDIVKAPSKKITKWLNFVKLPKAKFENLVSPK